MGGGGLPLSHLAPTTTQVGVKSGCSLLSFYEGAGLLGPAVRCFPALPVGKSTGRAGYGLLLTVKHCPTLDGEPLQTST